MILWNWIIGKGKKHRCASWFIASGVLVIPGGILLAIEYVDDIAKCLVEWAIALVICWAVWRFILFLFNIWGRGNDDCNEDTA